MMWYTVKNIMTKYNYVWWLEAVVFCQNDNHLQVIAVILHNSIQVIVFTTIIQLYLQYCTVLWTVTCLFQFLFLFLFQFQFILPV